MSAPRRRTRPPRARVLTSVVAMALALAATPAPRATAAADDSSPASPAAAGEVIRRWVGEAYEPGTDELRYREEHVETSVDGVPTRDEVRYRAPDGTLLARKSVDYTVGATRPDFRLEMLTDGYVEGARAAGNGAIELFFRKTADDELERAVLDRTDVVIDAGFHWYLRANWEAIERGDQVAFDFAAPSRGDSFAFAARRLREREADASELVVEIYATHPIWKWFVEPMVVTYDRQARWITRYDGLSNLNDDEGKSSAVRIEYPPGPEVDRAAAPPTDVARTGVRPPATAQTPSATGSGASAAGARP